LAVDEENISTKVIPSIKKNNNKKTRNLSYLENFIFKLAASF
jgi:hypothetical protein